MDFGKFNLGSMQLSFDKYMQKLYGMSEGLAGSAIFYGKVAIILLVILGLLYIAIMIIADG